MPRVGCPNIAAGPLRGTFSTLGGDTFLRSLVASARDYIFRSSGGHVHCQHLPEAIYSLHLHRLHCLCSPKPTQPNNKSHSLDSRGSLPMYLEFSSFLASACLQLSFLITTMNFFCNILSCRLVKKICLLNICTRQLNAHIESQTISGL